MRLLTLLFSALLLTSCAQVQVGSHLAKKYMNDSNCAAEGTVKVGNPYIVDGITYRPIDSSYGYSERGIASWYGSDFHGKSTANGECYNMYAFTAAHKTLPLPTVARVTNLENNKSVVVKINDRGPFVRGRIIDLSYAAAQSLGMASGGTAPVLVEAISGPHHAKGGAREVARHTKRERLVGNDMRAETLPTYVPQTLEEEVLDDTPVSKKAIIADNAAPIPSPVTEEVLPGTELAQAESGTFTQRVATNPVAPSTLPPAPNEPAFRNYKPLKNTRVFVQTGAFGNPDTALAQRDALKAIHTTAYVEEIQRNGTTLHRVRIGPFTSTGEAENLLEKALSGGFPTAAIVVEQE